MRLVLGALQSKQIPKIRVDYGSRWVGPDLAPIFFLNRPKIALNQQGIASVV